MLEIKPLEWYTEKKDEVLFAIAICGRFYLYKCADTWLVIETDYKADPDEPNLFWGAYESQSDAIARCQKIHEEELENWLRDV